MFCYIPVGQKSDLGLTAPKSRKAFAVLHSFLLSLSGIHYFSSSARGPHPFSSKAARAGQVLLTPFHSDPLCRTFKDLCDYTGPTCKILPLQCKVTDSWVLVLWTWTSLQPYSAYHNNIHVPFRPVRINGINCRKYFVHNECILNCKYYY